MVCLFINPKHYYFGYQRFMAQLHFKYDSFYLQKFMKSEKLVNQNFASMHYFNFQINFL